MTVSDRRPIVAFRHLLREELARLLGDEGMHDDGTADALVEIVTSLSRYQEEGTSLFPLVFLCDDLGALLAMVGGDERLRLGEGARNGETVRRALKHCAPLATEGWSIWFERTKSGSLCYGLFRTDAFVLRETPMEVLRANTQPDLRAIGVVQLGDSIVELRSASGAVRYVYLSGARSDAPPQTLLLRGLLAGIVRDVPGALRADTWTFYRRVFVDAMRTGHGSLVAVLPAEEPVPEAFSDGMLFTEPIDVGRAIARYRLEHSEPSRARVQALGRLLASMMGVDGITLLRSDGAILGYHVFIRHPPSVSPAAPAGGARLRTYELLASEVGHALVAAFYRSQDGHVECIGARE
jgi:hypothetical protein